MRRQTRLYWAWLSWKETPSCASNQRGSSPTTRSRLCCHSRNAAAMLLSSTCTASSWNTTAAVLITSSQAKRGVVPSQMQYVCVAISAGRARWHRPCFALPPRTGTARSWSTRAAADALRHVALSVGAQEFGGRVAMRRAARRRWLRLRRRCQSPRRCTARVHPRGLCAAYQVAMWWRRGGQGGQPGAAGAAVGAVGPVQSQRCESRQELRPQLCK